MYCALYRKWRPKCFDDIVGQEHIVKTLQNQVKNNKLSHAYLFTGFRGTGKTTCAKILAKAANCPNLNNGNPCNQCDICKGIDNGSIMDILEIDAASNNGVENIRDLREETNFTPTVCKYRVYIIDEVHMLSIGAFNALLKIMEEPPSYVMFILATTELSKVPLTILSRCQQFHFNKINKRSICERLLFVAKSENIDIDNQSARTISKFANGGLRDALSLLDSCISLCENNKVDMETVSKVISISDTPRLIEITQSIINKDVKSTLKSIEKITSNHVDPLKLTSQIIDIFKNIMIIKTISSDTSISDIQANLTDLTDLELDDLKKLEQLSATIDIADVFYILDVLSDGYNKISRSSSKHFELELAIIKSIYYQQKDVTVVYGTFQQPEKNEICELTSKIKELEAEVQSLKKTFSNSNFIQPKTLNSQNSTSNFRTNFGSNNTSNNIELSDQSLYQAAKKINNWEKVLDILSKINPGLCAALQDSNGYLNEKAEIIFIETNNSFFLELIRTNQQAKQTLKQAIFEVFGKKYRIGPYKTGNPKTMNESLISDIENLAKKNKLNLDIKD